MHLMMIIYSPYEKILLNMTCGQWVIFVGLLPLAKWLRQRTIRRIPILAMHLYFMLCVLA